MIDYQIYFKTWDLMPRREQIENETLDSWSEVAKLSHLSLVINEWLVKQTHSDNYCSTAVDRHKALQTSTTSPSHLLPLYPTYLLSYPPYSYTSFPYFTSIMHPQFHPSFQHQLSDPNSQTPFHPFYSPTTPHFTPIPTQTQPPSPTTQLTPDPPSSSSKASSSMSSSTNHPSNTLNDVSDDIDQMMWTTSLSECPQPFQKPPVVLTHQNQPKVFDEITQIVESDNHEPSPSPKLSQKEEIDDLNETQTFDEKPPLYHPSPQYYTQPHHFSSHQPHHYYHHWFLQMMLQSPTYPFNLPFMPQSHLHNPISLPKPAHNTVFVGLDSVKSLIEFETSWIKYHDWCNKVHNQLNTHRGELKLHLQS